MIPESAKNGVHSDFSSYGYKHLTLTTSLYSTVPGIKNNKNPTSCSHKNFSQPIPIETIQINTVLHVSMVALAIELEFFVTVTPLALKHAMLRMNRAQVTAIPTLLEIC